MDKIVQSLVHAVPKFLNDSCLMKTSEVFIPFKEIGIECLTREVTEINLFFESILKLVDINVCDIDEISKILGVNYNTIKEVVVDMIDQKYVITSENKIIMTPKGRRALETRSLVTIQKRNLNQILVNMITGEIISGDVGVVVRVSKSDICLNEEKVVDKEFLENHHNEINEIFQKFQIEDSVFGNQSITRELYKILNLAYERLIYIKNELYIYKNPRTDEYQFAFKKDVNEQYLNSFFKQVKDIIPPSLENFFERDYSFASLHKNSISIDETLFAKTMVLEKALNECGDVINDSVLGQFQNKRYMLTDYEYKYYFDHSNDIQFELIFIVSGRLKILFDHSIWNEIKNLSRSKTIYIVYDENEYRIEKELNQIKSGSIKKQNIILIKSKGIIQNRICFYPTMSIELFEEVYEMFKRPITLKQGIITYEKNEIQKITENIKEAYDISFDINEE